MAHYCKLNFCIILLHLCFEEIRAAKCITDIYDGILIPKLIISVNKAVSDHGLQRNTGTKTCFKLEQLIKTLFYPLWLDKFCDVFP